MAGNEVLRHVERRDRRSRRELPIEAEDLDGRTIAPVAPAAAIEDRLWLVPALSRLSGLDRRILVLHYYGGVPLPAVAARLGMPLGTIKARMARARARLQKELSR